MNVFLVIMGLILVLTGIFYEPDKTEEKVEPYITSDTYFIGRNFIDTYTEFSDDTTVSEHFEIVVPIKNPNIVVDQGPFLQRTNYSRSIKEKK